MPGGGPVMPVGIERFVGGPVELGATNAPEGDPVAVGDAEALAPSALSFASILLGGPPGPKEMELPSKLAIAGGGPPAAVTHGGGP